MNKLPVLLYPTKFSGYTSQKKNSVSLYLL